MATPPRTLTLVTAIATVALGVVTTPAAADPVRPGRVEPLTAPVEALYTGTASLDGTVSVQDEPAGAKARIDATVLFGKDSAKLRPGARARIREVSRTFTQKGPGKVRVTGYTDDLGPADHGLRLSVRRASAVADTLGNLLPDRGYPITAVGKGEQDPAVPNTSETNRKLNRRVIITLTRTVPKKNKPPAVDRATPTPPADPRPTPTTTTEPATTPSPTGPTETVGPQPTDPSQPAPPPTIQPTTAPPPIPGPSSERAAGWFDPVLASWLFLGVVVLLAAVLLARRLHRYRRPETPGGTSPAKPSTPSPPGPDNTTAAKAHHTGEDADAPDQNLTGPANANIPPHPAGDDLTASTGTTPAARATTALTVAEPHPTRTAPGSPVVRPPGQHHRAAAQADLDADLRTWHSDHCDLPRLSLLGPVTARAHGTPIARRKPFYTELLAYLALRPNGATVDQVADAFTLTPARVRNDMKILRDWLGTNPRTGRRHLPDARESPAGRAQGLAIYQVDGILVDLDLFNRLDKRSQHAGADSLNDLDQARALVRGQPFDQLRPHGWTWLHNGDRIDLHTEAAIQALTERTTRLHASTP